ncbi:AAA family ATPase [uncultured Desulfobacter sp.]|uniref:AAA family ATPase n=1 Tax=uncultured Desulfobacter sp. TaxID=240139 RepID=UPI0037495BE5
MNGFFVAGTDTDAGKTLVTAALVRQMRTTGHRCRANESDSDRRRVYRRRIPDFPGF